MKLRYQLKEIKYAFQLARACEKVKSAIYSQETIEYIIRRYKDFLFTSDKFIKFEVEQCNRPFEEIHNKIDNNFKAQIRQAIQETPFIKTRIQDYGNTIGRSYDLI